MPQGPSVVIPALNEECYLLALVEALHAQTLPPREIIVADAGSTDRTAELAREAGCTVVVGGMPAVGRNAGAAASTGEIIVFLDADVVPSPVFLATSLAEFEAEGYSVATSLIEALEPGVANEFMADAVSLYLQATRPVSPHALGACIFVRREAHIAVGGFNEEVVLAEDHDYVRRISQIGEFGVLKEVRLPVSMRRMEEASIVPLAINYVWSEMHALVGKPVYTSPFEYSFGNHGTPTTVAEKPVIDVSFLREQIDDVLAAFDEISERGRARLDRLGELVEPEAAQARVSSLLDQKDVAVMRRYLRMRVSAVGRKIKPGSGEAGT